MHQPQFSTVYDLIDHTDHRNDINNVKTKVKPEGMTSLQKFQCLGSCQGKEGGEF